MREIPTPQAAAHPLYERVELIAHLLRFSDRMFAIMSPVTAELQDFADLLVATSGPGLLFARSHTALALHLEDVATDLAQGWGVEVGLGESARQAIEQRLPMLMPEPRRAVAIIEEVERLPRSVLEELIDFIQRLDHQTGGRVRLVLLGGPSLTGLLQQLASLEEGGQIYSLNLAPPLEAQEPEANVAAEAPTQANPFPSTEASGHGPGLPARVLLIGGIAISLTLAVVMALLMRPEENKPATAGQLSIPLQPAPAPSQPAVTPMAGEVIPPPAPIGHPLADSPVQASLRPAEPSSMPAPPPVAAIPPSDSAPSVKEPAYEAASGAGQPASEKTVAPAMAEKPAAPAAAPKPAAPSAKKAGNWYAQQKADQYVLQVVSLKSGTDIEQFVARHKLKGCNSFRQTVYGQTLHTLTCGLYASREEAIQAAAKLPEQARSGKPYPRKIADIRKVMLP